MTKKHVVKKPYIDETSALSSGQKNRQIVDVLDLLINDLPNAFSFDYISKNV